MQRQKERAPRGETTSHHGGMNGLRGGREEAEVWCRESQTTTGGKRGFRSHSPRKLSVCPVNAKKNVIGTDEEKKRMEKHLF